MVPTIPSQPRERAPIKTLRLSLLLLISPLVLLVPFSLRLAAEAYEAEGPSMEPTLMSGDRFLVDRTAYGLRLPGSAAAKLVWGSPRPGDPVVMSSPRDSLSTIKRVIGVPGDVIEWRDGKVLRNGLELNRGATSCPPSLPDLVCSREALGGREYVVTRHPESIAQNRGPLTIPEGYAYVVGDHRDRSNDSRAFGPVPYSLLIGRASYVYWSPEGVPRSIR